MFSCYSKALMLFMVHFLSLSTRAFGSDAKFYDTSSNLGFALSTSQNATSTDLLFQVSAPKSAGWGAVGIGDKMDGALMFIMYPSTQGNGVTLSVRSTSAHNTPSPLSNVDLTVQSSSIENSVMTANIVCRNCAGHESHNSVDLSSHKQPWIWAVGPGDTGGNAVSSDSQNANINQHSNYGVFFVNMTATRSNSTATPSISGKADTSVTPLPGSVPALIIIHAVCLAGSFLLLFPLGVVALRWFKWVRVHWMLQIFATLICVLGLIIAITFSAMDPEYDTFDQGHQIIGILAVVALIIQALLGYQHHRNYKKTGQRTAVSHSHIWTGRTVIVLGMVNAVLGFSLAGYTPETIGIAVIAIVVLAITLAIVYFGARRSKRSAVPPASSEPSTIALSRYNTPGDEVNGYGPRRGEDSLGVGPASFSHV